MEYEAVIGLEIHIQLETKTKLFCSCPNVYGADPNTLVCPVCLGLPGALPVLNEEAVKFASFAALAFNMTIHNRSVFYRKNYFYPDLPKGYQITQYTQSFATDGFLEFELDGERRKVRIERMNLEEEAAKSIHTEDGFALLDFNRSGVPLLEIVTLPDIRSPKEARVFLEILRDTIRYLGISGCDMEKGQMRVDSNVSVRPKGQIELGTKVEMKNLNTFKSVEEALNYEIQRQISALEGGGEIFQETRMWDEFERRTKAMRTKEEAHDYRYFPDPDLLPLLLPETFISKIKKSLPELPTEKKRRYIEEFGLSPHVAHTLVMDRDLALFFERVSEVVRDKKLAANFVSIEIVRFLKRENIPIVDFPIEPNEIGRLLTYVEEKKISYTALKEVFEEMLKSGRSAKEIIKEKGLEEKIGEEELLSLIREAMQQNEEVVEKYRSGKTSVIGVLIGTVMRLSRGKADPQMVKKILEEKLKEDRHE